MGRRDGARASGHPLVFAHVGDLHLTDPTLGEPAVRRRAQRVVEDLQAIFADLDDAQASGHSAPLAFVYLPGDIAQNGLASEYAILDRVLAAHPGLTVRLIPGDHDRQRGTMDAFARFREGLEARAAHAHPPAKRASVPVFPPGGADAEVPVHQFYFAERHAGVRCLFLDMVSAGHGRQGFGLDFRLGGKQTGWLARKVAHAVEEGQAVAVFAHAYPADMRNPDESAGQELAGLFWSAGVRLVEMGHTHYNELTPDGRTLYAAARSVGQNEDGPVGYAVGAVDGGAVSWRFRQLQHAGPFVLITSPADRRLATAAPEIEEGGTLSVRAVALSDSRVAACTCDCSVDGGAWTRMEPLGQGLFALDVPWRPGSRSVSVRVTDGRWPMNGDQEFVDVDTVEPASLDFAPPRRPDALGSDAGRIREPWPQKGLRGDRLGPNRRGRKW